MACSGWGHGEHNCLFPDMARCALCAGQHRTAEHKRNIKDCKAGRGSVCTHLIAKCANCKGPYGARSDQCPKKKAAQEQAKGWKGKASMVQLPAPTPTPENRRTEAPEQPAEPPQDIMQRGDGIYASKHAIQDGGVKSIPDSQPSPGCPPNTQERKAMEEGLEAFRAGQAPGARTTLPQSHSSKKAEMLKALFNINPSDPVGPRCKVCKDHGLFNRPCECGIGPQAHERCRVHGGAYCATPCQCIQRIALPESTATSRAPSPAVSEDEISSFPPDFDTDMLDSEQGAQGHH